MRRARAKRHVPIEFRFSRRGWSAPMSQVMVRACLHEFDKPPNFPVNRWKPLTTEIRGDVFASNSVVPFSRAMRPMALSFWAPVAEEIIETIRPFREYIKEAIRRGDGL